MIAFFRSVAATAQKISYEHNNRLKSPLETAVWWVEHTIATHGFQLGRANTANMYWFTYHSIDVIVICLLLFVLIIYVLKWVFVPIVMCCCSFNTKKSKANDAVKKHN